MIILHANKNKIIQQARKGVGQANIVAMAIASLRGNVDSKGIIPPVIDGPAKIERTGL
jgi:hypothetical protein